MINQNTIQQITDAANIAEVVGEFVTLKKRGGRYIGLCPFHNEKTPSFTITPRLGIFKCFGCGKGGDVISFIIEHEKLSYPEALRWLAKKYNIEIQEHAKTSEQLEAEKHQHSLSTLTEFASKYFTHILHETDQGKAIGVSYFHERAFRDDTIKKFGLGFAYDQRDHFTKIALKRGYNPEFLKQTGLSKGETNNLYDGFRNRVMFPIHNHTGMVVGFTGRTLLADKKIPKYVNSPESEIFNKSKILYGLYFAKKSISHTDNCFLVEGQTDVISMHQSGIENVVASSGTSLTVEQIRLIKRYTNNVTIIFDGDNAGIKAAFRGIDLIIAEGMDVKVVLMPEGEDPDSFAQNHRAGEVQAFLKNNAKNFVLFKTQLLKKDAEGDPMKMAQLTREIVKTISIIPDRLLQANYIRECANQIDTDEQTLMAELNTIKRKKYEKSLKNRLHEHEPPQIPQTYIDEKQKSNEVTIDDNELELITTLIKYADKKIRFSIQISEDKIETNEYTVADYIVSDLANDDILLQNKHFNDVIDETAEMIKNHQTPTPDFFIKHKNSHISQIAASVLSEKYALANWDRYRITVNTDAYKLNDTVVNTLLAFKLKYLQQQSHKNIKKIKTATETEQISLMQKIKLINEKINRISQHLKRVILC